MPGGEVFAVVGQHCADTAEGAGVQDLPDDVEPGKEEAPQGLGAEQAAFLGELSDLGGLDGVQAERFLHQCVLAAFEGDPGARQVGGVFGGDVHDVDVCRRGQLLVGAVGVGDGVAVRELPGAGDVAGCDGREALPGVALYGTHEVFGDPAGTEHAPP